MRKIFVLVGMFALVGCVGTAESETGSVDEDSIGGCATWQCEYQCSTTKHVSIGTSFKLGQACARAETSCENTCTGTCSEYFELCTSGG